MSRASCIWIAVVAGLWGAVGPAAANPGDPDPGFSQDGVAEVQLGEPTQQSGPALAAVAAPLGVRPDGTVVLGGATTYLGQCYGHLGCGGYASPILVALRPDGSLD